MTPIKKIENACFLACIESFLKDHSISRSQEEMIKILKNMKLCSDNGVVNPFEEVKACKVFNIRFSDVPYHYPINRIYSNGSLIICRHKPSAHCYRFLKQEEEAKIIVMDPDRGNFIYLDKPEIESMNPHFYKIELE
jgi:hypothetical protein